ncbi:immunity 26/phosphotriesterase HocA family protein [Nonomuraea sp. NPDC050556]|uniref:immunity 26/phosphotriesterase HocA family protein n=1 Tax=Nonomuraea sp. NPDC050556 TaxID=3364369 RepID=UPI0037AB1BF9
MCARRRELPYREGDIFAVPLRDGEGYALGVVARMDGRGKLLGYFFGPRVKTPQEASVISPLASQNAIYVALLGDLGFIENEWPIVSHIEAWKADEWPMPKFRREEDRVVSYNEITLEEEGEERADPAYCAQLPGGGLAGSGYVELVLTQLI